MGILYPEPACRHSDVAAPTQQALTGRQAPYGRRSRLSTAKGDGMLWLIIGIILLIVAIAGGAIVHPLLFVLAILALLMFVTGSRGRTAP
jgi:hypothetical protein